MSDGNQAFIRSFEALKVEVNRRAGMPGSERFELDLAMGRDRQVLRFGRLLRYVRDVRNMLQHPQHTSSADAFRVSEPFLAEVLGVLDALRNPPQAGSLCVPLRNLFVANQGSQIGEIKDSMKAGGFSHVPILDDEGRVVGVFNEAAIFDYFWSDDIVDARRDLRILEIMKHCSLDAKHTETFEFVRPTTAEEKLIVIFSGVTGEFTRIGALFVTPTGKRSEPITGMLTPWDVLARGSRASNA